MAGLYCLFAAVLLTVRIEDVAAGSTSNVVQLDADTFAANVPKSPHFVMFHAPWCGHCKKLKPTWEDLADALQKDSKAVTVAQVDCTLHTELCSENDVTGYPTLKFFTKDSAEPQKYRGQRDLASLLSFVGEALGALESENTAEENKEPVKGAIELTETNFKEHVASGDHFVKFFAPWCGHCQRMAPTWDNLAQSLAHDASVSIAKVDCTVHRTLCNEFDVKGYPTLLWIKDGKKLEKYTGQRTHEDFKAFVEKMKTNPDSSGVQEDKAPAAATANTVVHLVESNFQNGIASGFVFVKFYAPWCGHCKRLAPTWDELGTKFVANTNVKIAKVDCTDGANRQLCANQKVNGFPTMFLYSQGEKVEEYDGNRSLDDMFAFVSKHASKKSGKDEL